MTVKNMTPLLCGWLLLASLGLQAQAKTSEKMVIGVYPLRTLTDEKEDQEEAALIAGLIVQVLQRTDNFEVLSGAGEDLAQEVRDKQKTDDYIGGVSAKQFSAAGALQAMAGTLNSYTVSTAEPKSNGSGAVNALTALAGANTSVAVNYTLDLVDVATGKSIRSYTFSASGTSPATGAAGLSGARDVAHRRIKKQISNWVVTLLDFDFRIHEVLETSKEGVPKTVLILGGKNMDLQKMEKLDVMEVTLINGSKREQKICTLQVVEVQGDFSTCKILGAKDALAFQTKWEAKTDLKIWFQPEKD